MSDSIQVAIKVRPLIKREKDENLPFQWTVADNVIVPVDPEKKRGEGGFQFDHIFDPEKSNQDVFETVVKPIIDAAVKGFNGTVFAYGQTSSGKTHTMLGTPSEPGIIPLAVNRTFESISETDNREFLLRVSYLEIYNEKVNDLLDPSAIDLKLREDTNGLVQVLKCKEEIASTPEIIMTIMKKGDKNRRIGETDMNERSSRSHTIFRITIESRDVGSDSDGAIQVSQLNLVDLAGSERARQTNATGERFKEGTHINLSLSSLGLVIKQLSEASENSKQHVNFRDSKLTRLLQASLGGNAMTTIICAVTPAAFDETLCTLSFASRAKSVKNKPQLNEVMSDAALLKRYKKQMAKLNQELERLKNEKGIAEVHEMESRLQEKEHKLQETDRMNQILEERIELLKNGIISAGRVSKEDTISNFSKSRRRRTWAGDGRNINYQLSPCALEPIKEDASPEKLSNPVKFKKRSSRKSIIQTVDLEDESFETAFTDFELELIKVAKEREEETHHILDSADEKAFFIGKPKALNRVKFQDDVEVFSLSNCSEVTPEKQKPDTGDNEKSPASSSPGTPKKVLRERLSYLTHEYNTLQEFTTLERQTLFAQKEDFGSSNEKIFMQSQIDGLLDRLTTANTQHSELEDHLSLSCKCIEDFCSLTPGISEPLQQSLFDDEKRKVSVSKLKNLQEELKNLKNEHNVAEKTMTPLEKKLTDDYNQCVQELEQVKSEKEILFKENTEMKKKLSDESSKLKKTETLVNTLRVDTDCLMEKLIQKNTELADLKERVVVLEKSNNDEDKSSSMSLLEGSVLKDKVDVSLKENTISSSDLETEILSLKEVIEEKTVECSKYRKFEEELKAENERLLQTLNETKTSNPLNEESFKTEISKLSEMLERKNQTISEHQKLEEELKQKIEELQQNSSMMQNMEKVSVVCQSENSADDECLQYSRIDAVKEVSEDSRTESITQECQTDSTKAEVVNQEMQTENIYNKSRQSFTTSQDVTPELYTDFISESKLDKKDCNVELSEEVLKLSKIIREKETEITIYQRFKEKIMEGIERLKTFAENTSETEMYASSAYDSEKIESELKSFDKEKLYVEETEILIRNIVQFNTLINKLKISINEKNIQMLDSQKVFDEKMHELELKINDLSLERDQLKQKIETVQVDTSAEDIEKESSRLRDEKIQDLELKLTSVESERNQLMEKINSMEAIISAQHLEKESLFLKDEEIQELKLKLVDIEAERDRLKEKIDSMEMTISAQDSEKEGSKLKDEEIQELILKWAAVEAERDQLTEKIDSIISSQNSDEENVSLKDEEIQQLKLKLVNIEAERDQLGANLDSIQADISAQNLEKESLRLKIQELELSLTDIMTERNQLRVKIDSVQADISAQDLKKEALKLKDEEIQELKQRMINVEAERDHLRLKVDSLLADFSAQDSEKEVARLNEIIDKLQAENDAFKQRLQIIETESNHSILSNSIQQELIDSPSNVKSRIEALENSISKQSKNLFGTLDESKQFLAVPESKEREESCTSMLLDENNQSLKAESNLNVTVGATDGFAKPSSPSTVESTQTIAVKDQSVTQPAAKNFELESSSIFANQTYFENMTFGQSFVEGCTGLITGFDETKDVTNMCVNNESLMVYNNLTKCESVTETPVLPENNKSVVLEVNKSVNDMLALPDANKSVHDMSALPYINKSVHVHDVSAASENNKSISQVVKPWTPIKKNGPFTKEELEEIKVCLEKENAKLRYDLESKIQETEEVTKNVADFKQALEGLQSHMILLTNENKLMSDQLAQELESNKKIVSDLQADIDSLTSRLSAVTEERASLKNELLILNEQLDNTRATTPIITDDDLKKKYLELQEKFNSLNEENISLSDELMEKIQELDKVKESKVQMYDHQCAYREKADALVEKINGLENENIMLSDDVTRHIEECDKLKETIEVMKQQLEAYEQLKSSENFNKDDSVFLKDENTRLTNELIELRAKVVQLNRENTNLSCNINLDLSDDNKSLNISQNKSSVETSVVAETSFSEGKPSEEISVSMLKEKVAALQEQVNNLTLANQKLGDLKLTTCDQCNQIKELNQNRRQLKLEISSLNKKHADLQKKFEKKCADVEKLKEKANESFNTSLNLMDSTLNCSLSDNVNVTFMEEKVQNLYSEIEELKENHNKLSNQYQDKCNELEKLQIDHNASPAGKKDSKRSKSDTPSRKSSRLKSLEKDLENLSLDLQELRKVHTNVSLTLSKYMEERGDGLSQIESLKSTNEQLKKECDEKVKLLEDELATLYTQLNSAKASEKEIQAQKLETDVKLESLLKEKSALMESLQNQEKSVSNLDELKEENIKLKNELEKLEDIVKSKKDNNYLEEKLQDEIDSAKSCIIKEIKSLINVPGQEVKELPKKSVAELFLSFLKAIMSKEQEIIKGLDENFKKTKRKLEEEKQQSIDAEKRASHWAETVERDLEKHQADLTELERKNQHLQDEICKLDERLKEAQHENQKLHSHINSMEADMNSMHVEMDKQFKNNIEQDRVDSLIFQEKERVARAKDEEWEKCMKLQKEELLRNMDKLNEQLESSQALNEDLRGTVECLELEIKHLKSTIDIKTNDVAELARKIDSQDQEMEHMDEIIQQLKNECLEKDKHTEEIGNLLKVKCDLLTEYKSKVETMKPDLDSLEAQLTERKQTIEKYKEEIHTLKLENKKQADILQDKLSSEEIKSAALNKQLNEYKNKNTALCCTIEEIKDRCSELEEKNENLQRKVRNSSSKLRVENEMQELQDENRNLKNQLEGSYNRIRALQESKSQMEREMMETQGKNELLEQELTTTQMTLATLREKYNNFNVQKLREKYEAVLIEKNNLVRDIDEKRMQLASKEQKLVEYSIEIDTFKKLNEDLRGKIHTTDNEKIMLSSQISRLLNDCEGLKQKIEIISSEKESSYQSVIKEKSLIIIELEECKKDKLELEAKNVDLDKEMDELVEHIHKQENEIAELQDKLITGSYDSGHLEKMKKLEEINEQLRIDLRVTEVNRDKLQNEIVKLRSEKEQLYRRIEDLNSRIGDIESRCSSRNSSKSNSPTTQKERRRRRRSDLYCQNRNMDENDSRDFTDVDSPSVTPTPPMMVVREECQTCFELRDKIKEMSLDIVSKNKKINMLEVQLKSENFPYQMKCNELNEKLMSANNKNSDLIIENQKLQRALMVDSSRDCHICRQRKQNRRDQSVQANIPNKISLTGMSSGIVEEHLKLEKMEKERNWMKDLCRSRARRIKELEQRVNELEGFKMN